MLKSTKQAGDVPVGTAFGFNAKPFPDVFTQVGPAPTFIPKRE